MMTLVALLLIQTQSVGVLSVEAAPATDRSQQNARNVIQQNLNLQERVQLLEERNADLYALNEQLNQKIHDERERYQQRMVSESELYWTDRQIIDSKLNHLQVSLDYAQKETQRLKDEHSLKSATLPQGDPLPVCQALPLCVSKQLELSGNQTCLRHSRHPRRAGRGLEEGNNTFFKTRPCRIHHMGYLCQFGRNCIFAHGQQELRQYVHD